MGTQSARPAMPGVAGRAVDAPSPAGSGGSSRPGRARARHCRRPGSSSRLVSSSKVWHRRAKAVNQRRGGRCQTARLLSSPAWRASVPSTPSVDLTHAPRHAALPQPRCATPRATSFAVDLYSHLRESHPETHLGYWVFPLPGGRGGDARSASTSPASARARCGRRRRAGREAAIDSWSNPDYVFDPVDRHPARAARATAACWRTGSWPGKVADPEVLRSYYHRVHAGHGYTPVGAVPVRAARGHAAASWSGCSSRTSRAAARVLDAGCGRSLFTEIRPRLAVRDRGRRRRPRPARSRARREFPRRALGGGGRAPAALPRRAPSTRSSRAS